MRRAFLLLLLIAATGYAQKPPTIELGFSPERVYDFSGIDNINAFNGNNVITLPLTLQYRVSNHLTYTLALVYNSKAWDYRYYLDEFTTTGYVLWAKPNIRSNAGVGWRVSMGRLLPPHQFTNTGDYKDDSHGWVYEDPSGAEHGFPYTNQDAPVQFTDDGTFLRMIAVDSVTRTVEFPTGEKQTFAFARNSWKLARIEDQFLNMVVINYDYMSLFDDRVVGWRISDTVGRHHTVRFQYFSDMADSVDRGMNVDYLDMQGANSQIVRYTFGYTLTLVDFDCHHSYVPPKPGAPSGNSTWFPLLTSITLPDNTTYGFNYNTASNLSCSQGLLQDLTLPTKGVISYTYQQYFLPPRGKCDLSGPGESSVGIKTRTIDGNTWQYLQTYGPAEDTTPPTSDPQFSCGTDESGTRIEPDPPRHWARTSILTPPDAGGARSRTDHYFSVYNGAGGTDRLVITGLRPVAYGDPITFGRPASAALAYPPNDGSELDESAADDVSSPSTTRLLSQEVWKDCDATGNCTTPLRATYRRNADPWVDAGAVRQIKSERTVFDDDTGCRDGETRVACHIQTDYAGFDRVGHWRTVTTTSNYPGTITDERLTNYLSWTDAQLDSAATKWVFTKYTDSSRTQNGTAFKATYCFDESGLLLRQRTLAGSSEGTHDVITRYNYENGNVNLEQTYGGDQQTVSTSTDLCNITLVTPEYWTEHSYTNSLLTASEPLTNTGQSVGFKTASYTRDATGLITVSTATDSLATGYTYKRWGALESVTPPGETATTYEYTLATTTDFAFVTATRDPVPGPTTDDVTTRYEYDRYGRLRRTERTVPGAGCAEQIVTYDGQGRKDTESVWKQCGTTGNTTRFRYDTFGRLTRITTPDEKVTTFTYAGTRLVTRTREIDSAPITTREEYDPYGRLVTVTENLDTDFTDGINGEQTTTYTYDAADHLINVRIPSSAGTQNRIFTYDGRGLLTSETHPELGPNGNGTATYTYDTRGHARTQSTGSIGLTFEYDAAERLIKIKETSTNRVLKELVYDTFDGHPQCTSTNTICRGKLVVAARYHYDPDLGDPTTQQLAVTESYQFDAATGRSGRWDRTVGTIPERFTGYSFSLSQGYDTLGNPSWIWYPCPTENNGCAQHQLTLTNTYTYGQLSGVGGWASNITYRANGLIDTVTHGNGSTAIRETWTPDPSGMARPATIAATNTSNVTLWTTGSYTYDGSGNITRIGDATNTTYTYDAFNRLASWTANRPDGSFDAVDQGYDAYGNNLFNALRGCGPTGGTVRSCYGPAPLPAQIVGTTNHYTAMTYDSAGNVIVDRWKTVNNVQVPARTYAYDALGVMTRLDDDQIKLRFFYTPNDERIAAVERITGGDGITRNKTTYTLRNFDNHLLSVWTVDPVTGAPSWKEDAIWRGDSLLARESASLGTTHYSLDHLGSPRAITNSSGTLLGLQAFAPFGAGGTSDGGALQFTGHERDAANLGGGSVSLPDYFHARFYDFNTSRFLSIDRHQATAAGPQSWNRYVYASNNPITRLDPDGRADQMFVVNTLDGSAFSRADAAALRRAVMGTRFEGHVQVVGPYASNAALLHYVQRGGQGDAVAIIAHTGPFDANGAQVGALASAQAEHIMETRHIINSDLAISGSTLGAAANDGSAPIVMIAGCSSQMCAESVTRLSGATSFGTTNTTLSVEDAKAVIATFGALARGVTPFAAALLGSKAFTWKPTSDDCVPYGPMACKPGEAARLQANEERP